MRRRRYIALVIVVVAVLAVGCRGSRKTPPSGEFVQVVAGEQDACAIATDGHVACWGWTGLNPPSGTFTQISMGFTEACRVRTDGTLACWGPNTAAG